MNNTLFWGVTPYSLADNYMCDIIWCHVRERSNLRNSIALRTSGLTSKCVRYATQRFCLIALKKRICAAFFALVNIWLRTLGLDAEVYAGFRVLNLLSCGSFFA